MIALVLASTASAGLLNPTWEVGAGFGASGGCGIGALPELALCTPSDPMMLATLRRRLVGPVRIGLDLGVQGHLPGYDDEVAALGTNALSPDGDIPRSSLAVLLVAAPKVAGNEAVSFAPLVTAGPGLTLVDQVEGGDGGLRLQPSGFLGIGARLGVFDRVGVEAELRHGLSLAFLEGSTLEAMPVGSARLSATVGF